MKKEESFEMVAKTFYGIENVLAQEIEELGASNVKPENRCVRFYGSKELMYKANIHLRTALRILKPIATFKIRNQDEYYSVLRSIKWEEYLNLHNSFAIDSIIHSEIFKNSHFAALRAKDAVVDRFREKYNRRPDIDKHRPDILINIHLSQKKLTVSLDSSGDSLHKRGYRIQEAQAPINEVLAAAMIKLSGWDSSKVLMDPMCGSGTIGIEAAMQAKKMPPGLIRKQFSFMNWLDYDRKLYSNLLDEIELSDSRFQIFCSDIAEGPIEIARLNSAKAMLRKHIHFTVKPYSQLKVKHPEGFVITNPPYGERLAQNDINEFYQSFGSFAKHELSGYSVSIISSNRKAMKQLGLKPSRKYNLYNGALECSYNIYDIFEGSYKDFKSSEE